MELLVIGTIVLFVQFAALAVAMFTPWED